MVSIWLGIVLGVIAALTGGLAGHLAAENKVHKWAFWSAALVSVLLLVLQGFMIQRDTQQAEQRGKDEQAQLSRIEKNTQERPVINVPAPIVNLPSPLAPKQTAKIARVKIWSGFLKGPLLQAGYPVYLNSNFANLGGPVADVFRGAGKAYVMTKVSEENERAAIEDFKRTREPYLDTFPGAPLPSDASTNWFTSKSEKILTSDDLAALQNGTEVIYLLNEVKYRDPAGKHFMRFCEILEPPAFNPEVWQLCSDFHEYK